MKSKNTALKFIYKFLLFCFLLVSFTLFVMSFISSANMFSNQDWYISVTNDNLIINLGILLLAVFSFTCLLNQINKIHSHKFYMIFTILSLIWAVGFSFLWLFLNRPDLCDDNATIFFMASEFANNNFQAFSGGSTYLGSYPFQVGILFFYEMIIRLTNLIGLSFLSYRVIQLLNIFFVFLSLYSLHKTSNLFFKNKKITFFLQILLNLCFPLYIYACFVYGEVPATGLILFALYLFLKNLKQPSIIRSIFSFLIFGLGMAIRNSNFVFLIAFVIISIIYVLIKKNYRLLLTVLLILIFSLGTDNAIMKYYEVRSGNELDEGVAITSLIEMGLQESTFSYGWWNGYHTKIYAEANYDHDLANEISLQDLRESIHIFVANPDYAFRFFKVKFQSQFVDGSINALYSTNLARPDNKFLQSIYFGTGYSYFIKFCHATQMVVYFGSFLSICYFISQYRKKKHMYLYESLFILAVLGGVLFQMIWEANSRYFFTYYIILFPYAALGYYRISLRILYLKNHYFVPKILKIKFHEKKTLTKKHKKFFHIFSIVLGVLLLFTGGFFLTRHLVRLEIVNSKGPVQIVCFGDSIWDLERGETGIEQLTEKFLYEKTEIYNCAVMGSKASASQSEERPSLTSMIEALTKYRDFNLSDEYAASTVMDTFSIDDIEYIIFSYGLNDYFSAVPIETDDPFDKSSYKGALRYSIHLLQETYPEIEIIIISPTYCQVYSYGKVIADSYDQDYGGGTGLDYVNAAMEVASEMNVYYVDTFYSMGITQKNGLKYLSDATHLTEYGRKKYSRILGGSILEIYRNNF